MPMSAQHVNIHRAVVKLLEPIAKRTSIVLGSVFLVLQPRSSCRHEPCNVGTSVQMLETFYGHTSNRAMATKLTENKAEEVVVVGVAKGKIDKAVLL